MHLSTEESPASWMVKLFGEVGGGVSERSIPINDVCMKKLLGENSSKTLQLEF